MAVAGRGPVRPAAVAGEFYPADAAVLLRTVDSLLEYASGSPNAGKLSEIPAALIAPHAGYAYSGPVAAAAYARLRPAARHVRHVAIVGPAHFRRFEGMALPGSRAFATPLGDVAVDLHAVARIEGVPGVVCDDATHAREHSLEVQLPFLQRVLEHFEILPVVVGEADPQAIAELVLRVLGEDTVVIVSSDLSHYLTYEDARIVDREAARRILTLDASVDEEHACGATPLNGLLLAAQRAGLQPELLDLRSSGDTAGYDERVVGYGAFAFTIGAAA